MEKLVQDKDSMPAFCDFPADHRQPIHITTPIELTFATVRNWTTCSRNSLARAASLGLAFKLVDGAQKSRRKIHCVDKTGVLLAGVSCKDGLPVQDNPSTQPKLPA